MGMYSPIFARGITAIAGGEETLANLTMTEDITMSGLNNRFGTTSSQYVAGKLNVFFNGTLVRAADISEDDPAIGDFSFIADFITTVLNGNSIVQGSGSERDDDEVQVNYVANV